VETWYIFFLEFRHQKKNIKKVRVEGGEAGWVLVDKSMQMMWESWEKYVRQSNNKQLFTALLVGYG
jgi:hypothetical protein